MHYTTFTVIAHAGSGTSGDEWNYDIPIIGSDKLYDLRPDPDSGTVITVQSGREGGYMDITGLFAEVCTYCEFNPFKVRDFAMNDGAEGTLIEQVIHDFMGETYKRNDNWNFFYPNYNGGDSSNLLGPFYFGSGYSSNQAAYGTTPYGANPYIADVFYHWVRQATFFTSNDGITASFEIWPFDTIKENNSSGTIDSSKFARSNGLIEGCALLINIWKREPSEPEGDVTYNYTIQLKGYRYNQNRTTFIDERLDGNNTNHVYNPKNPLDNKQDEGDEGGDGDWNKDDPGVDIPSLPTLDISSYGGLTLFRLSPNDFSALMSYLESHNPTDIVVKWLTNPIQALTSCYVLPYGVPVNGSGEIKPMGISTGVAGYKAKQWYEVSMGSMKVKQGFGNTFLDYSPFTKVSIYLPFCGMKQLNADDIIGNNVGVHYQFDNISGSCVAYVTVNSKVRYTYTGSCAVGVPLSQQNWGQTFIASVQAATSLVGGAVGGALSSMGNAGSMADVGIGAVMGAVKSGGDLSTSIAKPTITRSGTFTGSGAALGILQPYLLIERPDQAKVDDPRGVIGLCSGRTLSLGNLSGFTKVDHCNLKGISGTAEEVAEIEALLQTGVIF